MGKFTKSVRVNQRIKCLFFFLANKEYIICICKSLILKKLCELCNYLWGLGYLPMEHAEFCFITTINSGAKKRVCLHPNCYITS